MPTWPFLNTHSTAVTDQELVEIERTLIDVIRASAEITLKHFRTSLSVDNKLDMGFDPVTIADKACETFLSERLQQALPSHGMFGEEHGFRSADSGLCWVVDPIDGTRSYICGVPLWGTLMALNDGQQPILGAMYQPWSDELYIGSRRGAFFLRGDQPPAPLQSSSVASVAEAKLACTTIEMFEEKDALKRFQQVSSQARLVRFGTDCYGYALLAQGGLDIVIEASLEPYDIQAMIPIIQASGGVITDWEGGDASLGGRVIATANPSLHQEALQILNA